MQELDQFRNMRSIWVERTVEALARGSGVRENIRLLMEQYFDLLMQSVETGNPAWLDPIFSDWSTSLTQTDLERSDSSLASLIKEISLVTYTLVRQELNPALALDLLGVLLPCFSYSFEHAAQLEMRVKLNYQIAQLNQVKQSLEKLDRSKSDFIAIAAHELKTPLTLIDGYTAMLHENLTQSGLPPYQAILTDGIRNGTRRLSMIINDMIDVSLIDNNLLSLNYQPVWVNRLISILEVELSIAFHERNQNLEINDFPGYGEMTFGDPERLLQVFRNVLLNAIKFTPDGGKISISGRKLPGFLEVIIRDTGIGIDPEDTQVIFDKFVRLGNTALHSSSKTKYKGGGPGLGLRIAKGILETHGGAIWVESEGFDEKKLPGSTFHILIPMVSEPPDSRMARLFAPLIHPSQTEKAQ